MFVLRNIINHELYSNDLNIDGELMFGLGGWINKEQLAKEKDNIISKSKGDYYVDDWEIIELDDKLYNRIERHLNNDTDYKAFYYNSGVYEILNSRTGRLTRYEK